MSMLQKIISSGVTPTYPSQWYVQDTNWAAKTVSVAADRYTLVSPNAVQVDVGGVSLTQYSGQTLDLSLDTNWDFGQGVGVWTANKAYSVNQTIRPTKVTSPTDLSGCSVWLDASQGVTYDGSNRVSQWSDMSGNARHITQATDANKPIYTTNVFNGKPTIRFDGSNDVLSANITAISGLTGVSMFAVTRHIVDGYAGANVFTLNSAVGAGLTFAMSNGRAAKIGGRRASGDSYVYSSGTRADSTSPLLLSGTINYSTGAMTGYKSGVVSTTGTLATTGTCQDLVNLAVQGNGYYANSDIAEIIVYNRLLTDAERIKVEQYLANKYGVGKVVYNCTTAGTSHATAEPVWNMTIGGTTAESGQTLVWTTLLDNTGAVSRAGQDFYVYAVARAEGSVPKFLCSANATYSAGYTANNSRKVAGFHCLCNSTGTISSHSLTGYVTGDILPLSCWDLMHKSTGTSGNVGQTYNTETGKWAGIYPLSGSTSVPTIVYGGTILVSTDWNNAVDTGKVLGMQLPSDHGFQSQAAGSNEQTVINGAAIPATCTGAVDSAGRRMISNIGCEMCCGALDYWLDEQSYRFDGATAHTHQITTTGAITTATVANGGTGGTYAQGEVLTVVGSGTSGTVTIATVNAGQVLTVTITTAGTGYKNSDSPASVTGGGGTGCTLTITTAATKTSTAASADVAPAWGWQAVSGSKGSIYKQGTYGDVKLTAGGKATGTAANAGSRGRDASNWRWYSGTGVGIRLIANSIDK